MLTSPSCSCCDESCTSLCSGDEPSTLLVSIGGFLDDVGTCCSPINGNYVLTYSDVDCRWSYLEGSYCSSYILLIDVWITDEGGGNYKINLQVQVTTGLSVQVLLIRFSETVVGMPDCCDWDTLSLTLDFVVENDTATFDCDTTSIAAYITSFCGGDAFGESEGYSSATGAGAALSDGAASASSSSTSSGVGAMLVESVADADADSTAPGVGAALFDGVAAADGHATAEAVSPSPECCGCNWLEDYWLDNKRLRLTFSGAITGYIILDAEPELVGDACSQWSGSDDSNIDDADCFLLPMTAQVTCEPGLTPTVAMEILLTHGSTNCNIIIDAEPDSYDCGPGLEVIWTATIEEALPTCDCDTQTITLMLTNEDTP